MYYDSSLDIYNYYTITTTVVVHIRCYTASVINVSYDLIAVGKPSRVSRDRRRKRRVCKSFWL